MNKHQSNGRLSAVTLCQDCLCQTAVFFDSNECAQCPQCGGDCCDCASCMETLDLLKAGVRDANALGVKSNIRAWSPVLGAVDA